MTILVLGISCLLSLTTQAPQPATRIHLSAQPQPVQCGPLKFTLVEFKSAGFLRIGEGYTRVEIENTSAEAVNFSPSQLYFVGKDGAEASILGTSRQSARGEAHLICATGRMIAPLARIRETYILSEKLRMPADFYYQDKLVATIQD
ncbi:MAG TPA: hypothetical protein VKJ45_22785 [Blastocatellia bacterium]|nr:hypothetical protein [Blastocatellia bacterium]